MMSYGPTNQNQLIYMTGLEPLWSHISTPTVVVVTVVPGAGNLLGLNPRTVAVRARQPEIIARTTSFRRRS